MSFVGGSTVLFISSHRESERHARHLLHPLGLSVPELTPNRVRVVVFRDEKGIKQPIFDSQQLTNEEGEVRSCDRTKLFPIIPYKDTSWYPQLQLVAAL